MSEENPPPAKRLQLESDERSMTSVISDAQKDMPSLQLLSERLKVVLQCTVCREMPHPEEVCQCPLGHIMCESCAMHLMADATLRQRTARCPHCRQKLQYKDIARNLPLTQALWELPTVCRLCKQTYEFKNIDHHVLSECPQRQVICKYSCIGCQWQGAYDTKARHESECKYPTKSARDILIEVQAKDNRDKRTDRGFQCIYNQLSCLRMFSIDMELQLQMQRGDYFESKRFFAFDNSWIMRVRINDVDDERKMSYCLVLMSTPKTKVQVHFFLTKTPREPLRIGVHVYKHAYNSLHHSCGFKKMCLADDKECNRLLALKTLWVRIWMFLN